MSAFMIAGRPVRDFPLPFYADSVQMDCSQCKGKVWVGPRQQAVLVARPDTEVRCMPCAAIDAGDTMKVASLGNPGPGPERN